MTTANPELQLAGEFVRDTGCHIFLTGKAGTGKTTFLQSLKKNSLKRLAVTAPTGVAAINAGGVTLHSFFQLPFGPFVPGSETNRSQYRFSNDKIGIIKSLDLLIIDEISMVRADLLDGVDSVLRRFRRNDRPFGGVQLLMIGDLFQLPPVVREDDWRLLNPYYASPYFFNSKALGRADMVTIELQHIYRQTDSRFIKLLNRVRNNRLDPAVLRELNARYLPDFVPDVADGYITLSTHNRSADSINASRLGALPKKVHRFEADVTGDFPEHTYPTAAILKLKAGAQVMFVRNDLSPERRYFNGKIGTISRISGSDIRIQCPEDAEEIVVEPATWENIDYTLDQKTMEITEKTVGTFRQYPLRLAWAITIHKSQGLTFDKAIIDAQAAFAYGQVYVALSRCRTLDGMVLSRPLRSTAIKTDPAVCRFIDQSTHQRPSADQLEAAKIHYQQQLLMECFDFQRLRALLGRLAGLVLGNPGVVRISGVDDIRGVLEKTEDQICTVGDNFQRQLQGRFPVSSLPANDAGVVDRITKAAVYFHEKIAAGPVPCIADLQVDTDNTALKKKITQVLKFLREEIDVKLAAVQSCERGFSASLYFRAISAAAIDTGKENEKGTALTYSEADISHPALFQILKDWRARKAEEEGIAHYRVLHQKTLIQIAVNLPDTLPALKGTKGVGKRLAERYGEELVALVGRYRRQHQIETVPLPATTPAGPPPKKPKTARIDTKKVSLELFEKGLTLADIAEKRGLVLATIESHMAYWVAAGKVEIDLLLSPEKREAIERQLSRMQGKPFGEIKQVLGTDVSYGEIKLVKAHLQGRAGDN
ncbi:helix-turn-helix domain-containing protein [uncultured Desulfosarcina sp.]|uniref:helix-turn-helix domain-containing protein n=1 Tax=uncultured Desulfosarcina sp. TaxID=218289 RepID=UPI0029C96432|nr:helix-turn-helix domain-containing protein [uncultured Desulfosarcina sp.]